MTVQRRSPSISITVPEDVKAILDGAGNASAYVTTAVRKMAALDRLHAKLDRRGITVTPEGVARAGARLRAVEDKRRQRDTA
jgi:hypothetical protein